MGQRSQRLDGIGQPENPSPLVARTVANHIAEIRRQNEQII
ncbi:Uncharacterised protein [Vibrio cholerae]|nr:Uncharacterised protein [Vibrio cholerae]